MTRANLGKRGGIALLALFSSVALATAIFAPSALAASCGSVETSIIDCSSANDTTGSATVALLVTIIQILTGAIGIVAIGALVYAGSLYASASGSSSQVAKAKELIANTVIGLVLFAGMGLLLNYLIPGGLFSGNAQFGATDAREITLGGGVGAGNSGSQNGNSADSKNTIDINVATYNIRASNLTSWDNVRATSIFSYMKTVDVVGIQEGRPDSVDWLTSRMKNVGYARTTTDGYARQIFYSVKKFTFIKEGAVSISSDKRLVWVKLKDKTSGTQFYVANVHLKFGSSPSRISELKKALPYMTTTLKDAPIIFLGDMNSTRADPEYKLTTSYGFKDMYDVALSKSNLTYRTSLTNFKGGTTGTLHNNSKHQIDHIYIKGNLAPKSIAVVLHRGSDHLPVQAKIGIADSRSGIGEGPSSAVSLKGIQNFRDLAMLNSSLIKPNTIYRSAKLQDATTDDRQALSKSLSGGVIIDFRTTSVRSRSPDAPISGVPNLNYPVEGVTGADGYVRAFVNSAAGRKQFGAAITKIANTQGPALLHCTAGKDRTGWMVAMLMYTMGASDAQVMTEYLKSQDAGADFKVDKAWLNAALSAARKNNDGSIMNYITSPTNGLGVSNETITKLKAKLAP